MQLLFNVNGLLSLLKDLKPITHYSCALQSKIHPQATRFGQI